MRSVNRFTPVLVIIAAAVIRLPGLSSYPPLNSTSLSLRILSAIAGILSVALMILIVNLLTHKFDLAVFSGLGLAVMPWHIEQSRIYSPAVWGLMVLLLGIFGITHFKPKILKAVVALTSAILLYLLFPELHIFSNGILSDTKILQNVFKLLSVKYLFFKNDSFWSGGLRDVGVMLPYLLPVFFIGLFEFIREFSWKYWPYITFLVIIFLLSAAQPKFPEQRLSFLLLPWLAYMIGWGFLVMHKMWHGGSAKRILTLFLIGFILYDYVLFFHFYTHHYKQRVKSETTENTILF